MHDISSLQALGLTEKQAKIYSGLIHSGASTVSTIAKVTGLHRPTIYATIPSLQEKGLVSGVIRGKLRYFVAESPEKLDRILTDTTEKLGATIKELAIVFSTQSTRPIFKFFEGKKGIQHIFLDIVVSLKKDETYYRYSSTDDQVKGDRYLPLDYKKIRDNKRLQRMVIASGTRKQTEKASLDRAAKYIPQGFDLFSYDVTLLIYGSKIAFVDYNSETGVIIENAKIAEFQRKLFLLMWSKL